MKTTYLFFILIAIILIFSSKTHAQDHEALFGNWGVDFTKTTDEMNSSQRTKYEKMTESARVDMRKSFQGRSFSFKDNGVVAISMNLRDKVNEVTGSWSFTSSVNELIITVAGVRHSYQVEWKGSQNVLLKYNDVPDGASISSLYLVRK